MSLINGFGQPTYILVIMFVFIDVECSVLLQLFVMIYRISHATSLHNDAGNSNFVSTVPIFPVNEKARK